eukprot:g3745.t1
MSSAPPAKRAKTRDSSTFLKDALRCEIMQKIVNKKANACPMSVRVAWHASGTFDAKDNSGDAGEPEIPSTLGRTDEAEGAKCPANGRLPDAALGAQHLRDVFYRMGFNDREIVALSGAHTLGRCHKSRSGFDGKWTQDPLAFDNSYFKNLLGMEWTERKWDGPTQFEDPSGTLMMLPTDMAVKTDPSFRAVAEIYAKDESAFRADFATAFAKLLALGCPAAAQPSGQEASSQASGGNPTQSFLENCMHGSKEHAMKAVSQGADVKATEANSGRSALHKAAFWGHDHLTPYLLTDCAIDPNLKDSEGDTAAHDAARFGHVAILKSLVEGGADLSVRNNAGKTAADIAVDYNQAEASAFLNSQ